MAETNNNFTGAKMNKDIDDRLIPANEYRNAVNLEISRSENSDVGSLQTILGNELAVDFENLTGISNLDCIGYFVDTANNRVFLFLTDYTDTNPNTAYSTTANNFIYMYNVNTSVVTKLVEGPFLNFSKNSPMYGVNLLEDLLFWTDNRNQPRKISVSNAANSSTYYTTEDQISVAKLSPVHAIELYAESVLAPGEYETTMKDVVNEFLPPGGCASTVTASTVLNYNFQIAAPPLGMLEPAPNQIISGPGIPDNVLVDSYDPFTFTVTASAQLTLTAGQEVKFNANRYYDPDYIGDPTFLEDKFVRFSYRYKFDENEYSIFAPFTQAAFIPKQDGYFLYEENPIAAEPLIDDETAALRSTVVSFMYNKVNNIKLIIPLPCAANVLQNTYKIAEIEILYKESDGLAVQIVDVISVDAIVAESGTNDFYVYNYLAKKPFRTLPEKDLIRVYDKTPVRALGQEIISNRVVYSNYQDKQSYPKFLNYNVACTQKAPFTPDTSRTSIIEYPNHSVKQNRNYQVGVVLSDKFGRQSGVILSNATIPTGGDADFVASSLYVPYKKSSPSNPEFPDGDTVNEWPGLSLKVRFNSIIDGGGIQSWPGIYNGDASSPGYNPLGWYSYKIVVKQTEQDYYNVYAPGVMAAYPTSDIQELTKTSHVVLMGDNINKVPRDLNDVSNTQEQYRSSVKLYSRVNNVDQPWLEQQYYPGNTFAFVNTIATVDSLFSPDTTIPLPAGFEQFYQVDSNPLIARLATEYTIGVVESTNNVINLAVLETNPDESRLDLYWETTTSGLITDLNAAILEGTDGPYDIVGWDGGFGGFSLNERASLGDTVVEEFYFVDIDGNIITTITLANINLNITNTIGQSRNNKFSLIDLGGGRFKLITNSYFYFGYTALITESYTFDFGVTVGLDTTYIVRYGQLGNRAASITTEPVGPIIKSPGEIDVFQFTAVNGSNPLGGLSDIEITWEIFGPFVVYFTIDSTGLLQQPNLDIPEGLYALTVRATDAGGDWDEVNILVQYGQLEGISTWVLTDSAENFVTTNTQNSGTWALTGYIDVLAGYTAKVQAGSFPYTIGANSVNTEILFVDFPLDPLIKNAPTSGSGGLSTEFLELPGPGQWHFSINASFGGTAGGTSKMFVTDI